MSKRVHSKAYFLNLLQNQISNIDDFYTQSFLNYRGVASDTKESYEDIATRFVLENLSAFESIKAVNREASYRVDNHELLIPDDSKRNEIKSGNVRRLEEWLAKSMYGKNYENLGKIIDFQVPINNISNDKAGKIDLIAYSEHDNVLYLLEFKKPDSKETLLRCILEVYTYYRQIYRTKLLKDFSLPVNCQVLPAVLIYKQSYAASKLNNPLLQELRKILGIHIFLIKEADKVEKA